MLSKDRWPSWILLLCIAFCGLLLAQRPVPAQSVGFAGVAVNVGTGLPISGAQISAAGHVATTDVRGRYFLPLSPGMHDVRAEAPGYIGMVHKCRRLAEAAAVRLDFEMVPKDPSPAEAFIIDEKLVRQAQDPPPELTDVILAQGYALSMVTSVPRTIRVLMPDGSVVVMEMDEYLKGVVPQEVPQYWPPEALRAQAVAARSYASTRYSHADEGADVCTTTHCQAWSATHYDTTDQAVDDTHGVVATYGGSIIYAFFHAHCDGRTRNVQDVWGGYLPYCQSVSCPCGYSSLFGHGVGMCQQGARVLAEQGLNYANILRHYYTGIEVTSSSPGRVSQVLVYPLSGDENTEFTYEAAYTSNTGDLPVVANVIVDGHAHSLCRVPGDIDGAWLYRWVSRLPLGEHTHRFHFDDGYGHVSSEPVAGAFDGPLVTEADPTAPTPTPVPTPPGGVLAHSFTHSTVSDWAGGTIDGTCTVDIEDGALTIQDPGSEGIYVSVVLTAPFAFVGVGITWCAETPQGSSISFQARTTLDGVNWGDWHPLEESEDGPGRHGFFSSDLLFGLGTAVRYRVTLRANPEGASPSLKNVRLVCVDSSLGPSAARLAALLPTQAGEAQPIIPRSAWGADESIMTWPPEHRSLRAVILHHTAAEDGGVDPAALVRAVYYYHAIVLERGDVGYNYLIDHLGNIYEGRAGGAGVVGSHAQRFDWGSIGIALIGDYCETEVPEIMVQNASEFLAWQCADHSIHPLEERQFIDVTLPNIMAHRDCGAATCPGDQLYALLPTIRSETLSSMAHVPPHIRLTWPTSGEAVRAVVHPSVEASAVITRVEYYVDGVLRASDDSDPLSWGWNTLDESEADHVLRIVAYNGAGQSEDQVRVSVDNTPPDGSVSAPPWSRSTWVAFALSSTDAMAVRFSNDWIWEGEDLEHEPGTGEVVVDASARNELAWRGMAGVDQPGGWYGPYACALPSWRDYQVCFRLKTPSRSVSAGLATIDVVDDQGRRSYASHSLAGTDFAQHNTYEEFGLTLEYRSQWPTCEDPDVSDGLEFRTWFSGNGDLYLDRVTLFGAPQTFDSSPVYWTVRDVEGPQTVIVRFLDAAGNATDHVATINLDMTPPMWLAYSPGTALVQDTLSGLDTARAEWSGSADGGITWGEWQPLDVAATPGTTDPIQLVAPDGPDTHLRFRVADMAGNASDSAPQPLAPTPTTITPSATLPVETVAPTVTRPRSMLPLILKG